MSRSADFYARAAAEIAAAEDIEAKATEEDRALTSEEEKQYQKHLASAEIYRGQADMFRRKETVKEAVDAPPPNSNLGDDPLPPDGLPRRHAEPRDIAVEGRHGFPRLGDFVFAVKDAMDPGVGHRDQRLNFFASTGMEQATGSRGGFLVPPTFSQQIWDGLNAGTQSLMGLCDQFTIEGDSLTIPANAETSRANGSRYGGVRGYWLAEGSQMTASYPKLRQVKVEPKELAVLVFVTDKLLKNATALEQYITRAATDEIGFKVGDAIINGDGTGKPMGIANSGAIISVAKETSQAADTIVAQNLRKMRARMHPNSWPRAVWLVNQDCLPELDNLFTQVTNVAGSENVGGFDPRIYDPVGGTLFGKQIVVTEYNATVGDNLDIILADMKSYIVGTKGGVDSAMSIHLKFDYNETAFRWIFSVDGQSYLNSAITPYKGSNTLSTFVSLAARA